MKTKKLIFAALFAALTCVATMIIKVPTPTMGYIHPGDSIVLLSGFLLGPVYGGLAAGIGSMFSDLFGGYFSYAPATFVIKTLTAVFASLLFRAFTKKLSDVSAGKQAAFTAISGAIGEAFMVFGYFVFEIFLMAIATVMVFHTSLCGRRGFLSKRYSIQYCTGTLRCYSFHDSVSIAQNHLRSSQTSIRKHTFSFANFIILHKYICLRKHSPLVEQISSLSYVL